MLAATYTLCVGLVLQAILLSALSRGARPACCKAIFRAWRPSLFAGFMGALASQFWFLAFAIATAASVRTLALVEVLFAQGDVEIHLQAADQRARSGRHRAGGIRRRLLVWAH